MHIKVNGASLFFDVEGAKLVADGPRMREKPTLILLHGAPGVTDHSSFKPLFSRLTEAAQIIYLDLRGGGRSPDPDPSNWTLAQWADDLNDFCQTLGVDRPVVLGQSGGGFVAMAYAARYPEAPAGLILASTQARFSADRCLSVFRRLGGERAERAAASFFRSPTAPDALVAFREHCLSLYNRNPQDTESPQRVVRSPDLWSRFGPSWYVGPVDWPRLGGHMRSYESAVGVCHGEAKASIVHEGLQGGGRGSVPEERQEYRGHRQGSGPGGNSRPAVGSASGRGWWQRAGSGADHGGA